MKKKYYSLLAVMLLIYFGLTLTSPVTQAVLDKYNITVMQLRLIQMSLAVPIAAIWCFAFYGFVNFKQYAHRIRKDADGKAFNTLANGLVVLGVGMTIQSLLTNLSTRITTGNKDLIPLSVIINNYVAVVISLLAFYFIFKGSKALNAVVDTTVNQSRKLAFYLVFGVLGAAYAYAVLTGPNKRIPVSDDVPAQYYLSDWLILATIILPYLAIWFMGLTAAGNIANYRQKVKGIIYKNSLKFLSLGLLSVIISSIMVQMLSVFPSFFQKASLVKILVVIYILLLVIAVGYVLIAKGAKKLNKLEGV